jgi:hypothetical protein
MRSEICSDTIAWVTLPGALYVYMYIYVYMCVFIHIDMCIYIHTHIHINALTPWLEWPYQEPYVRIYVYICVYVCIYSYRYVYLHLYTYTYICSDTIAWVPLPGALYTYIHMLGDVYKGIYTLYVYVHIQAHRNIYTHIYTCIRWGEINALIPWLEWPFLEPYTYIYKYMYTNIYIHVPLNICVYLFIHICVLCVFTFIHIYIYMLWYHSLSDPTRSSVYVYTYIRGCIQGDVYTVCICA